MNPVELLNKMEKHANDSYESGKRYVLAKEEFERYDDLKKIRFEQLIEKQEGKSWREREHKVLISTEWGMYLAELHQLKTKRNKWQLQFNNDNRMFDCYRSMVSYAKKEIEKL